MAAVCGGFHKNGGQALPLNREVERMQLGLVTYMWGADWDLPTLIDNLKQTGFAGVARTALTLSAVEGKLKAAGCDAGYQKFREVSNELGDPGSSVRSGPQFDPAKPMVDVRPSSMR